MRGLSKGAAAIFDSATQLTVLTSNCGSNKNRFEEQIEVARFLNNLQIIIGLNSDDRSIIQNGKKHSVKKIITNT